ncbi:MAG TPA: FHA domain-containing protein [Thermoanaerobaculia bacterium]|nr:FHA domain-containing protein [Thermoanaerobaculia bacterium]
MAYRFGPFLYDPVRRGLTRDGAEIPLTHKVRALLTLFLENPGRLLTRDEIVERVWPDVAVSDDALRFQVAELRRALGKEADATLRTIRGEGYRFDAVVQAATDGPRPPGDLRFRLVLERREVPLLPGDNVLGRDPDGVLWIDHPSVSRRHARIVVRSEAATLEDLGSKNGTFLNDEKLERGRALADGDAIRIGPETMIFRELFPGTTESERQA